MNHVANMTVCTHGKTAQTTGKTRSMPATGTSLCLAQLQVQPGKGGKSTVWKLLLTRPTKPIHQFQMTINIQWPQIVLQQNHKKQFSSNRHHHSAWQKPTMDCIQSTLGSVLHWQGSHLLRIGSNSRPLHIQRWTKSFISVAAAITNDEIVQMSNTMLPCLSTNWYSQWNSR